MSAVLEDKKELLIQKWGTLNTVVSPNRLPEGHSPNLSNVWTDEKPGSVVTALGYRLLGTLPSNLPVTFAFNYFKSSDGSQTLLLSDGSTVYATTDFVNFSTIITGLATTFQLRALVIRDKVWFVNGINDVRTYDGSTVTILDGTAGTPDVPIGKYIAYHDERVWIYGIETDLSSLRFSALATSAGTEIAPDHSSAWPTDNQIQISEGDADVGTSLFIYRGYLFAAKQFSIYRITGYDEYTYSRVKTRSSTGTRFHESVQIRDNLVEFIGVDGLYTFDGEQATRVSDIISPSSPDVGVFAFQNIQQPLTNNNFWNVSETADINAGTVPSNMSSANDRLALIAADDTAADFNAGTHDTTEVVSGSVVLTRSASRIGEQISIGKAAYVVASGPILGIGSAGFATNGEAGNAVGFNFVGPQIGNGYIVVDAGSDFPTITRVRLRNSRYHNSNIGGESIAAEIQVNTGAFEASGGSNGTWVTVGSVPLGTSDVFDDVDIDFSPMQVRQVRLHAYGNLTTYSIGELEFYKAGYDTVGKFVSKTLDYSAAPGSFGSLAADINSNLENYQFFTQSSADGSTWSAEANVSNGGAITSPLNRYLRWGVYLYSSTGVASPVVASVFVGGSYISQIHDTGGDIFAWSAFAADYNAAGQTVTYYYRAAASTILIASQPWTAIVSGAIPAAAVTDQFIQIRVEMSTNNSAQAPSILVNGFTVNWILSNGTGVNTLQNVASYVWANRYWLAAASLGSAHNDIVLVHGKSTFGSPWHKRDFSLLSFCRFQDYFVGGSSVDGSIYRLESGYSKADEAMDSYFETAEIGFAGFHFRLYELLVTLDRLGPYTITIGVSTDGAVTWTDRTIDLTRDIGDSLSATVRLNVNFRSDSMRFRIRNNAADQPFSVDSIQGFYKLLPSRGTLS